MKKPSETLLDLRTQMQQHEPKPNSYMFKHTYQAAKETYDNCIRIINTVLCTEGGHCECFEPKSQTDDLATFITTNWHHCPFSDNCGIDFEKECTGWQSPNCAKCILRNSNKLNIKEN